MAFVAAFDLETCHLDSVNTFLNSPLAENVFCRFPDGFKKPGYCMKLNRALYGLRSSPILWQKNFSNTLCELGLEQIPEEPCLFPNGRIIVFFYVDDIVLLARKKDKKEMEEIKAKLMAKYEMRDLGELHWFFNVKILRDRGQRKLWLCQSAYIDKIVASYKPPSRAVHTPLSIQSSQLVKYDGQAMPQEIHAYQCRVGSIIYL